MQQDLARRVLFVVRTILVVALVAGLASLRRSDSRALRRDVIELDALAAMTSVDASSLCADASTHAGVWKWLHDRDAPLDERRRQARQDLVAWLAGRGFAVAEFGSFTGKLASAPQQGKPFFTETIAVEDRALQTARDERAGLDAASVNALIDTVEFVLAPTRLAVVTSVELSGDDAQLAGTIDSIGVDGHHVLIQYSKPAPAYEQNTPSLATLELPVGLEIRDAPSLWDLGGDTSAAGAILRELARDADRRRELRARYGLLPLTDAQQIARRGLGQAYESVSLFGFSFAPRRVPFAVLFFLGLTLGALAITVAHARRGAVDVLAGLPEDSVFTPIIRAWWTRFLILALLPAASLWLALPAAPLPELERTILEIAAVVLAALGLACFAGLRAPARA